MLSKVTLDNYQLGTEEIIKYINNHTNLNILFIQDNLHNFLLIKTDSSTFLYNYKNNKVFYSKRIQLFLTYKSRDYIFSKSIDSFDQNNIKISNKLRTYVIEKIKHIEKTNTITSILGIGGEYYMYFPFINAKYYIGISNHLSIVQDAMYNIWYSVNYLVDYNNVETFPKLEISNSTESNIINLIILNVYNIHKNIIKYIKNNFKKGTYVIIITCNLVDSKYKLLLENFKLNSIKTFDNTVFKVRTTNGVETTPCSFGYIKVIVAIIK